MSVYLVMSGSSQKVMRAALDAWLKELRARVSVLRELREDTVRDGLETQIAHCKILLHQLRSEPEVQHVRLG